MRSLLFNPGPTNVSPVVRDALIQEDICHREKEFYDVLLNVNQAMVRILKVSDTHEAILFGSSGTGCNEAIINSIHGKILLLNNGKYSARLGDIAKRYNIPVVELAIPPYEEFNLSDIENILVEDDTITHILLVHHETTTGVMAPLLKIGELARKYNKILAVDAISSLGGHELDLERCNVAFCSVSANKCIESFPGVSFVIARRTDLLKLNGKSRSYYFDMYQQWSKEKTGETPYTPPVQIILALKIALEQFEKEGIENRIDRYKAMYHKMRNGLQALGFKALLLPHEETSNVIISLEMPEKMDYWQVHDLLKAKGITIYSSEEVLKKRQFRVATMGYLKDEDIERFITELGKIKLECGF